MFDATIYSPDFQIKVYSYLFQDMYNKYLHGIEEVREDILDETIAKLPARLPIGSKERGTLNQNSK